MKLHLLAVGHKMPDWISAGYSEYAKRMPREARLELSEIRPEKRSSAKNREQVMEAERQRIEAALPPGALLVALDEHGRSMTTPALAQRLAAWMQSGRDVAFVIGGADGLHPALKARADLLWSLSELTLPHAFVRVFLAEQLYRATTILQNHPYHRE